MKSFAKICFIVITVIATAASEACDNCVPREKCVKFGNLSNQEQDEWLEKYQCDDASVGADVGSKYYGFDSIAKGDFVCCSASLASPNDQISSEKLDMKSRFNNYGPDNYYKPNGVNNYQNPNYGYGNDWRNTNNGYQRNPSYYQPGVNSQNPGRNYFQENNNPYATQSPFFPGQGFGGVEQGAQCPITSLPPGPETGCCGREASATDRITGNQRGNRGRGSQRRVPNNYNVPSWPSWSPQYPLNRVQRSADEDKVNVTIGNRIAGGHETDFTQFPWTVLLKTTFDYGDKRVSFNCGGSLISSKYVLTAGHCIYDEGGKIIGAEVYLAEYNKQTFPRDCKFVLGEGQKCIENIVMNAEDAILHPQYDDERLTNDIGLIRLQSNAPYTDYIRPICLPTIDIDSPEFSNLRLAVAGWGRNGRYRSDIKQSTIVNLVPQEKCIKYYPNLSRRSMCAAGYTGEDTCKGDSGGPLMTLYGGKYQVVGVVSGKRADSPCGTAVPSLYTNVYHYLDWIRSNMRD